LWCTCIQDEEFIYIYIFFIDQCILDSTRNLVVYIPKTAPRT
jgi:hypothetical protein